MAFRPTYEITIGQYLLSNKTNNRLVELEVEASLHVPVNACRIRLPQLGGMQLENGLPVTVKLGYDGRNTKVFTGALHRVEDGIETASLTAMSAFRRLTVARGSQFFENPTAASIVLDLCRQAGVTPARVDTGMNFSFYALGGDRSFYEHLRRLAEQCGFDLYADAEDHLFFGRSVPVNLFAYEAGASILSFELYEDTAVAQVEVYGESPASLGQGTQGASWLTKKEIKGSAGAGAGTVRRVFDPSVRTLESASQVAQALQQRWKSRKKGRLKVLGAPDIQIGENVQVSNMAGATKSALFKVTGFTHWLSATAGFTSQFKIEEP